MKVYVGFYDYGPDGREDVGVFSTFEKAVEAVLSEDYSVYSREANVWISQEEGYTAVVKEYELDK